MPGNVTFIVGNGLDLSLGLETSYVQFYEYVKNKKSISDNRIYKEIREDPDTWANFELTLGQYTHYIEKLPEKDREMESKRFHEDLLELTTDLGEYLDLQENEAQNLADEYKFSLNQHGFFDELQSDDQKSRVQVHVQGHPIMINLVTLNYTKTLEKILADETYSLELGLSFGAPLHIHGTTSEFLTLGVSEVSQLFAGMSAQEKDDLIKPRLTTSLNDGRIEALRAIISSSSLIVLFGTSIGETDKYIWASIVQWLDASTKRHIIIHKYDTNYSVKARQSPRMQREFDNKVQDELLKHSRLSSDSKNSLRKQIFVVHNTKKLFVKRINKPKH